MFKARFIGRDKSMGFRNGKVYLLTSECIDSIINVVTVGGGHKLWCPYSNIESFLKNWDIIACERMTNKKL